MKLAELVTCVLVSGLLAGSYSASINTSVKFGRHMRKDFYLEPDFIEINHGSVGRYPLVVYKALREFQDRSNKKSSLWYRRDVETEYHKIRPVVGKFMNCDPDDVVLVANTHSGITAVLRSWPFQLGDRLLHFNTFYLSIQGIIRFVVDIHKGNLSTVVFNVTHPITTEDLLANFEKFLDKVHTPLNPITMAFVDHISALPTIVMPIDRIVEILKKRNILVLVDGAHAFGQVPIDLAKLDPDYYITNTHKWGYTARSSAILYVKKTHQGVIHPAVPSGYYKSPSDFQNEFFEIGTIDYSPYMTIPTALEYRQSVGGEQAIMSYIHDLAWQGGNYMAKLLGTRLLQYKDQVQGMADVQLPVNNPDNPKLTIKWWVDTQLDRLPTTFTPPYKHNGQWWIRTSAQIYMDITDYEVHAKKLLDICNDLNSGKI